MSTTQPRAITAQTDDPPAATDNYKLDAQASASGVSQSTRLRDELVAERAAAFVAPRHPSSRLHAYLALVTVITPMLGVLAAVTLAWGWGIGWTEVILLLIAYGAGVIGIEVGMHRHFSHRAFQARPIVRAALGILGSMGAQGPVIFWAAVHRRHHNRSDQPGDPHSPHLHGPGLRGLLHGIWHAHVGWLLDDPRTDLGTYAPDLLRDRLVFRIHRWYPLWLLLGLALPAAIDGLITGTATGWLLGFIWGGLVRTFLVHHATWSVNSLCHSFGSRPFATRDQSTNNAWLAVSSLGGSWHNNHHAFPYAARNSFHWWQLDPAGSLVRLMEILGLAWDVKLPSRQAQREYEP